MIEYHTEVDYLLFDWPHSFINQYFGNYSAEYFVFLKASGDL